MSMATRSSPRKRKVDPNEDVSKISCDEVDLESSTDLIEFQNKPKSKAKSKFKTPTLKNNKNTTKKPTSKVNKKISPSNLQTSIETYLSKSSNKVPKLSETSSEISDTGLESTYRSYRQTSDADLAKKSDNKKNIVKGSHKGLTFTDSSDSEEFLNNSGSRNKCSKKEPQAGTSEKLSKKTKAAKDEGSIIKSPKSNIQDRMWLSKKKSVLNNATRKKRPLQKIQPSNQLDPNLSHSKFHSQFKKSTIKKKYSGRQTEKPDSEIIKSPTKTEKQSIKGKMKDTLQHNLDIIKEIAEKIEKNKAEDLKFEEMKKKIKVQTLISSPNLLRSRQKLSELNSHILESTLMKFPPGLQVVDSENYHTYFDHVDDLNDADFAESLPKILKKKGDLEICSYNLLDKLFKVISRLNDDDVHQTFVLLEKLLDKIPNWEPKYHHIVVGLINFGVSVDLCPFQEFFVNQKLKLVEPEDNIHRRVLLSDDKMKNILTATNVTLMLDILKKCLSRHNNYTSYNLSNLIVILYWLLMDKNYLEHPIVLKIKNCCALALDHFNELEWLEKMDEISLKLVKLDPDEHHHNLSFIVNFLPTSQRGMHLKQVTSFKALHILHKKPVPTLIEKLEYREIYKFLRENPILVTEHNCYETHSIISLIISCFNLDGNWKEEHPHSLAYLKKIAELIFTFFSRSVDSMRQQDTMEVRNKLLELRCKIVLYYQGMDVHDASLERIMDNTEAESPKKGRKRRLQGKRNIFDN